MRSFSRNEKITAVGVAAAFLVSGAAHNDTLSSNANSLEHGLNAIAGYGLAADEFLGDLTHKSAHTAADGTDPSASSVGVGSEATPSRGHAAKQAAPIFSISQLKPESYQTNTCLDTKAWSVQRKLGLLPLFGIWDVTEQTVKTLNNSDIAQMVLMKQQNSAQLKIFKKNMTYDDGGTEFWVVTDAEGGAVQTYKDLVNIPSEAAMSRKTPAEAGEIIARDARILRTAGIDQVLAPVGDQNIGTYALGDRTFGTKPAKIAAFIKAYDAAWNSAGIVPTLKHFPRGLGSEKQSYLPAAPSIISLIKQGAFKQYDTIKQGDKTNALISNDVVPGLTGNVPADLSPLAVSFMRQYLHLTNTALLSDNLNSEAVLNSPGVDGSMATAAVMAVEAGDQPLIVFPESMPANGVRIHIQAIMGKLMAAVRANKISMAQLDTEATAALATRGIDPCK
jgi:beta-N-acetylhexosaminidase